MVSLAGRGRAQSVGVAGGTAIGAEGGMPAASGLRLSP